MTRSFGDGPDRQKNKKPDLRAGNKPGWQSRLDSLSRYKPGEVSIKPVRVEFGKRLVAGILDLFAAYLFASVVGVIPFMSLFVSMPLALVLALIVRDWLYQGRGIGKNLMGLQVVDVSSGAPCSLGQSIKRNLVPLGPMLILYIVLQAEHWLSHFPALDQRTVDGAVKIIEYVGGLYTMLVVPYEAYRAHGRTDGCRFGDQFAGTAIVEAPMDFSQIVTRRKP